MIYHISRSGYDSRPNTRTHTLIYTHTHLIHARTNTEEHASCWELNVYGGSSIWISSGMAASAPHTHIHTYTHTCMHTHTHTHTYTHTHTNSHKNHMFYNSLNKLWHTHRPSSRVKQWQDNNVCVPNGNIARTPHNQYCHTSYTKICLLLQKCTA